MAVIMREHKDDEHRMLVHLLKHFDWEANECFPNVGLFDWESDLLVLTSSGYLTEVEVKHSMSDWRADHEKTKFKPNSKFWCSIKRFYYAVPAKLYEQHQKQPVVMPPQAGLLVYGHGGLPRLVEVQQPKNQAAKPITSEQKHRLLRSVYFRFHRQYIKGLPKPVQPKKGWS